MYFVLFVLTAFSQIRTIVFMKIKRQNLNLGIMILLASISLYLATRSSLFFENLTYIGNLSQYRPLFLVWGISQSLFYGFLYYQIIKKWHIKNQFISTLTILAIVANIISFILPYQNHSGDLLSQIHVYMSIGSSVLTCFIILWLIQRMQQIDFNLFLEARNKMMIMITLVGFMAILLGDFTSIMELIFTNGISYLLITMIPK